jgi:hypothetical protein
VLGRHGDLAGADLAEEAQRHTRPRRRPGPARRRQRQAPRRLPLLSGSHAPARRSRTVMLALDTS